MTDRTRTTVPRAEARRRVAVPVLLALMVTGGCSWLEDETAAPTSEGAADAGPTAVPLLEDADRLAEAIRDLLDERAAAVRRGDVEAVVAGVADDPDLRRDQRRYARNLTRLPLATFRYGFDTEGLGVADGSVTVPARLQLELDGYDTAPVRSAREMVLVPDGPDGLALAADGPSAPDPATGGEQPWDAGTISTERTDGVLGVFDADSARAADVVTDAAAAAADDVADLVPYEWSGDVVVYAPSDIRLLSELAGLPGGVADRLDGVAFGVSSAPGAPVVAERVILHPRMLDAAGGERDRLLRHELVHVALGARDDLVPRWLSEGAAEWVSVQPLPPDRRLISEAALDAARAGVDDLPSDEEFNAGPRSGANYGLSWQVCEEIAATYGAEAIWTLLDAMGERDDRRPELVLRRVLGTTGPELVAAAADRILAAYG